MRKTIIALSFICAVATGIIFYQRSVVYDLNQQIYQLNDKYKYALLPYYPASVRIYGEVAYFGNQRCYSIPHNTDIIVSNVLKKWTDSTFSVTNEPIKYPPQNIWGKVGDTLWLSRSKYVIVDTPVYINFFKPTK